MREIMYLPEEIPKDYRDKFSTKIEQILKDESICSLLFKSISTASNVYFFKNIAVCKEEPQTTNPIFQKFVISRLDAKKKHPFPSAIDFYEAYNQFHFDGRLALIKGNQNNNNKTGPLFSLHYLFLQRLVFS